MTEEFDVVVVGSGAGGGFAAMSLTESGLRVLLIERGRQFQQGEYPMVHPDWEIRPLPFAETIEHEPSIVLEQGSFLKPGFDHLRSRILEDPALSTNSRRLPFKYHRTFGLGGSTLQYQGEAHRFSPDAFQPYSAFGFGIDWPIGYTDLEPYYERAERILGVAGDNTNPFKPARDAFPTSAHKLSPASQLIEKSAAKLGWSLQPNSLALPTESFDGRAPCQGSGGCAYGCIYGAKSSVDLTAIARALRTGNLTIRTKTRAVSLDSDRQGTISGIVCRDQHKKQFVARGKAYVLATGAIETPRLLLASVSEFFKNGLSNNHDMVGRYFMESLFVSLDVLLENRLDPYKGVPIDSRIWDTAVPDPKRHGRSGFVLGVSGTAGGYHGPTSYALLTPGLGTAHKNTMREQFGSVVTLLGIADHDPGVDNRITLSDRHDEDNVPLVRINSSLSHNDLAVLEEMLESCRRLMAAAGVVKPLRLLSAYDTPISSHVGGTCRMGSDAQTSVVDSFGQSHTVPNLFITDASVLPGQGAGDSPSLTIQALAMRTADRVSELFKIRKL